MITDDKLYEVLTDLIAERKNGCDNAFKLFVKLYTAIVGGAAAIGAVVPQPMRPVYAHVSVMLVIVVTVVTSILLFEAKRGWWEYRKAQSRIVADNSPNRSYHIPPPKVWPTLIAEIVMGAAMWVACALYWAFHP
jgi:hypothetical protein